MVSYQIPAQLATGVLAGRVFQIFSPPQYRPALPGEVIRLVNSGTGEEICCAVCTAVSRLEVVWTGNRISQIREVGRALLAPLDCARRLGFADLTEMSEQFRTLYGARFIEGFLIEFGFLQNAPAIAEAAA